MSKEKILIIGANGQIGTALTAALQEKYGMSNVVASDIQTPHRSVIGIFEKLDVLDMQRLRAIVLKYEITQIYHLAAILSAKGEQNPRQTWDINMNGLWNVLEVAREEMLTRIYYPSTIAVFGSQTPADNTPQFTVMHPRTIYGITKQTGEQLCDYYARRFNIDVRSLRYPGIVSYETAPGGGTTDYAVDIFFKAAAGDDYECFLSADTALPMLYMPDAIRATLELMDAPKDKISVRYGYNLQGMSFTPAELAAEIQKHLPDFKVTYKPDHRQEIADSWVNSMDDTQARADWGWQPEFDIATMTADMLKNIKSPSKSAKGYNEMKYL
jgi:nucleoside-diphosphate-sugar epimerase